MNKRIAFLISDQHLIPHGGIGQFAKGFCEMAERHDCIVDLILDTKPRDAFFEINGLTIYPDNPLSMADHRKALAWGDSYCLERAINFRDAFMKAVQNNLYDLLVINTPEGGLGTYMLDIAANIPYVFYTHNENLVFRNGKFDGVFNPTFESFFVAFMGMKNVVVGTQTERNADELQDLSVLTLPMPMPERGLLEPYAKEKSGLLFIGRWEDRKNPDAFLKVAKETGLPVKVMTAAKTVKKWQDALDAIGVQHDVRGGIIGQEKVDFIRSSKVFFMPSKSESYGFSLFEAAGHCHCVCLDKYDWTDNWDPSLFHKVDLKDAAGLITELYSKDVPESSLATVNAIDSAAWTPWENLMADFEAPRSESKAAKVNQCDDFWVEDFIKDLGRGYSIEDVQSIMANRHKFQVTYTKDGTWMSSKGTLAPAKNGNSLFDFG